MKIKTLQDLEDTFEVLSHAEKESTLGGVYLISAYDGNTYDVDDSQMGYITSYFTDTDPGNLGGSFSYTVDDGNGNDITINVEEGTWGVGRFSLTYVDSEFDINAFGNKYYYDNVTGYSFQANFARSIEQSGGYSYEDLPDARAYDAYGGYTTTHIRLENILMFDELTGGYKDYSRFVTEPGEYYRVELGGYTEQQVQNHATAANQKANDISSMLNNMNGSKLATAKKTWDDNPSNFGQPFDYMNYARSIAGQPPLGSGPTPISITVVDQYGIGSGTLKEFYNLFKAQIDIYGLEFIHSFLYNPW